VRYEVVYMKIGVFVYDWAHLKSVEFLRILSGLKGHEIVGVYAKEWGRIPSGPPSKPDDGCETVGEYCANNALPYYISGHGVGCVDSIVATGAEVGVIAGARILPPCVIAAFGRGVINLHPGVLPWNRGLDNVEWGVLNRIPQGVTAHLIDRNVDRGEIINVEVVKTPRNSIKGIYRQLFNLQKDMLIDALECVNMGLRPVLPPDVWGPVHKPLSGQEKARAEELLPEYLDRYGELL